MIKHIEPTDSNIPALYKPTIEFELNTELSHSLESVDIQIVNSFLSVNEVDLLINLFNQSNVYEDVSVHGMKSISSVKGSTRTTVWSEELAKQLSLKLFSLSKYNTDEYSRTDSWQFLDNLENQWSYYGFSPLLRFMRYDYGGKHFAHYDAAYIYPDPKFRTLKSVVIYLTTNNSGSTRLIMDDQEAIKQKDRINQDWIVETKDTQIFKSIQPIKGNMLIFDHRICHDVEQFIPENPNETRIIIRGDLIYKLND